MPAPPLPHPRSRRWRRLAQRALLTLGIGVAIALLLSLLPGQRLVPALAYAVCISLACWLFIDGGRMLAERWVHRNEPPEVRVVHDEWPGWGWMSAVLLLGTLAGYSLGHALARRLLGHSAAESASGDLPGFAAIVLLSMIPGTAATYFYYSRARLAKSRVDAEQAERLATEQRLRLLASQLEPHMLFNTLANLRALIATDPARAQAMLDRLIVFLRATLGASRASTHTLADEFARLADYLALMQIRMGARLQSSLSLPDELASLQVPTLLLQPLVENAIKHGLEPHVPGGRIEVSAAREGNRLVLRVRDNGAGIAPGPPGFGLVQVRERLTALYGAAASVELAAARDGAGGTLATLSMPL